MKERLKFIRRSVALTLILALCLAAAPAALAESFAAYVSASSASVWSDAKQSKRVGSLEQYSVVTVVKWQGDVAAVLYYGNPGYMRVRDLHRVDDGCPEAAVAEKTKVYLEPKTSSPSLNVSKGTKVRLVKAFDSGWAMIEKDGVGAYIQVSALAYISETPVLTATPAPTATPSTENAISGTVTADKVKVYKEADTSSKYLGTLGKGTQVNVLKYNGSWAYIELNGNYGYCAVSALTRTDEMNKATPTPTAAPTATPSIENAVPGTVTADKVKVYASASASSKYLGTIGRGTQVNVLKWSGGWAYIELNGNYGYCALSALTRTDELNTPTPAPTATPSIENAVPGTVTVSKVKVYAQASASSKYLGTIGRGTQVNVLKWSGGWAYIELNGNYGYCALSALTRTDELNTPTPTVEPTLTPSATPTATPSIENAVPGTVTVSKVKVYAQASASSKYLGTIGRGTQVNVLKWSGGWAYIELNGNYGYCALSALTRTDELNTPTPTPSIENAVAGTVTADKVKVYASANASSKYLGTLGRGTQVNVLKWSGGWAYIELNGNYGYCKLSALTPTSNLATPAPTATPNPADIVPAVVTASKVKVYASANASSKYLGTLGKGTQVNVIAWKNGWAYIELNGNYGYCTLSALTRTDAMPTPTPVPDETGSIAAVVTADKADVYSGMDGSIKLLGTLKKGTQVTVLQYWSAKDAAYIELDGSRGYCKLSALTRADALATPTPKPDGSGDIPAVVMADSVKVYSGIGDTAQYLGTLSKGALVTVKQYWSSLDVALIQMNSNTGYCKLSALTTASLSSGSKGELVTRVQQQLYSLGYFIKTSSVDGDFGSTTVKAVKLFQKANGLSETGNVDASTLSRMFGGSAVRLPSGTAAADYVAAPNVVPGNQQNNSTTISSTLASGQSTYSSGMSKAQKLEYVIYVAQNQLGKPYVYAANGPSSYDCTGFTKYCFKQIGVNLQRTALNQGYDETYTKISSISDLRRGDLVYLNTVADADLSDHAGIYLGAGYFIHASSGQHKVVISTLASGYYNRVFSWGRRVFD